MTDPTEPILVPWSWVHPGDVVVDELDSDDWTVDDRRRFRGRLRFVLAGGTTGSADGLTIEVDPDDTVSLHVRVSDLDAVEMIDQTLGCTVIDRLPRGA